MAGEATEADEYSKTEFKGAGQQECVLDRTHEIQVGELELNDKIKFGKVPKGAIYLGGFIACDDLDSNGTPLLTLAVGDDDDPDGLLVANNVGQAGGKADFDGAYITNKTETAGDKTISLLVAAAAATAQVGTVRVVVRYYTP